MPFNVQKMEKIMVTFSLLCQIYCYVLDDITKVSHYRACKSRLSFIRDPEITDTVEKNRFHLMCDTMHIMIKFPRV